MTDSRTKIKSHFRAGTVPSESDFAALIDMMVTTDVFESTIATLRDASATQAVDPHDREIRALRSEREELEARIDREIALLRSERDAIEPFIDRPGPRNGGQADAAASFLEREIAALRDERQTVLRRQDREIAALRDAHAQSPAPAAREREIVVERKIATPPPKKRQAKADGQWQPFEIEDRPGAFAIVATVGAPGDATNTSATMATIVTAGSHLRPSIRQVRCFDGGLWLLLAPLGGVPVAAGAYLVAMNGIVVWQSPWSAAGAILILLGLGSAIAGLVLHKRRAISIAWRREGGPLAFRSTGAFRMRTHALVRIGRDIQQITYTVKAIDG